MLAWRYKTDKERERERKKIIERKQIKEIGLKEIKLKVER
jgi:hypothetical protein